MVIRSTTYRLLAVLLSRMHPRSLPYFFLAGIAPFLFVSCNHSFTPKGPFRPQLTVYSVLSSDREVQFVRVYTDYDVAGFDPFENRSDTPIAGAQVVVTGPRGSYILKDTALTRADTSRYKSPIAAYTGRWRVEPGQTYTLTVTALGIGTTSASVETPGPSQTIYWVYGTGILDDPDNYKGSGYVGASTRFWATTKAYSYQMVIEYAVLTPAGWRTEGIEVPLYSSYDSFEGASYPSVIKSYIYAGGGYSKEMYVRVLQYVVRLYAGSKLTFKRIVFRFLQVDQNWYDYYNTVRKFQDMFSIRLDEPDFTNLSNGYGLFGAFTVDSLEHAYPPEFPYNR